MKQYSVRHAPFLRRILGTIGLLVSLSNAIADDWVDHVVKGGEVGNGYGHGQFPSWGDRTHPGLDIGGGCGLEVIAPARGAVVRVVNIDDPRYSSVGNAVVIQHIDEEETIFTAYFHLKSSPLVKAGIGVYAGQTIGYTGETGIAKGCHLHFEVRQFDGIDRLFHPEFKNIYLSGDRRDDSSFKHDWLDPVDWLDEQTVQSNLTDAMIPNTPSNIAKAFYELIIAGDVNTAFDLISKDSKSNFNEHGGASFLLKITQKLNKGGSIKTINVISEDISGNDADVIIEFIYGNNKTMKGIDNLVLGPQGWRIKPQFTPAPPTTPEQRAKIRLYEIMRLAMAPKSSITEYFQVKGRFPTDANTAGINTSRLQSSYLKSNVQYSMTQNTVEIVYTIDGQKIGVNKIDGKQFIVSATIDTNIHRLRWACTKSTIQKDYLPKNCQ